ncbi:DUF1850 domain-containing protein [Bacillus weihaiensis]|uniref:DUF1850 domain-containing protein n=1 Tax=Bacillus weihaiensis TaxID=1547283 RepID=UPI0023561081|nr:DUF1850 domain-containing protein [Bacillus weihaiensis]
MKKRFLLVGSSFLFLIFVLFTPYQHVLSFTYEDTEKMLAYVKLSNNGSFSIQYTHSIHLSDVVESYSYNENHIILKELSFEDFAVGMPSNAEGNEIFEVKDNRYSIKKMNRIFPFIDLRIGQVRANHQLLYKNKSYTLADTLHAGEWVRISMKKLSIWQQLKGVKLHES